MLRRKLLLVFTVFALLMLGTAVSSILLMQGVLSDMDRINGVAMTETTATGKIQEHLATIESQLNINQHGEPINDDGLSHMINSIDEQLGVLEGIYTMAPGAPDPFSRLERSVEDLYTRISELNQSNPADHTQALKNATLALGVVRQEVRDHASYAFEYMKTKQHEVTQRFRWTAIGMAIIFVVLINGSIIVLLRAANFVLKPIDRLLEASRHLAREEYGYRVDVGRKDEFDELARGFNSLAAQLEKNEERKVETLHQVARTLNHELNNAIAIIDLQLRMVSKSVGSKKTESQQLQLIDQALRHMNKTVIALTQVRRVVLTEYTKGVKMLDLERSTQPSPPHTPTHPTDPNQADEVCSP